MTSKQTGKSKQSSKETEKPNTGAKNSPSPQAESETVDQAEHAGDENEHDESEELDELLELFEDDALLDLDPEEAVSEIDEWYEIINESGDAELKEIGKGLKQLKKVLTAAKTKPEAIAEALTQLGEQTDECANNAQRGYKTKLHKLGKALSKAGKSVAEQKEEQGTVQD
jgi:hypothetical protein